MYSFVIFSGCYFSTILSQQVRGDGLKKQQNILGKWKSQITESVDL